MTVLRGMRGRIGPALAVICAVFALLLTLGVVDASADDHQGPPDHAAKEAKGSDAPPGQARSDGDEPPGQAKKSKTTEEPKLTRQQAESHDREADGTDHRTRPDHAASNGSQGQGPPAHAGGPKKLSAASEDPNTSQSGRTGPSSPPGRARDDGPGASPVGDEPDADPADADPADADPGTVAPDDDAAPTTATSLAPADPAGPQGTGPVATATADVPQEPGDEPAPDRSPPASDPPRLGLGLLDRFGDRTTSAVDRVLPVGRDFGVPTLLLAILGAYLALQRRLDRGPLPMSGPSGPPDGNDHAHYDL